MNNFSIMLTQTKSETDWVLIGFEDAKFITRGPEFKPSTGVHETVQEYIQDVQYAVEHAGWWGRWTEISGSSFSPDHHLGTGLGEKFWRYQYNGQTLQLYEWYFGDPRPTPIATFWVAVPDGDIIRNLSYPKGFDTCHFEYDARFKLSGNAWWRVNTQRQPRLSPVRSRSHHALPPHRNPNGR